MLQVLKSEQNSGFTLIELIVVIGILAILAAIAVPNITVTLDNARRSADLTNADQLVKVSRVVITNNSQLGDINGVWDITESGVNPIGTSSALFAGELENSITIKVVLPKYRKIIAGGADRMVIKITDGSNQDIGIYASNGTDEVEVYPEPNEGYEKK